MTLNISAIGTVIRTIRIQNRKKIIGISKPTEVRKYNFLLVLACRISIFFNEPIFTSSNDECGINVPFSLHMSVIEFCKLLPTSALESLQVISTDSDTCTLETVKRK